MTIGPATHLPSILDVDEFLEMLRYLLVLARAQLWVIPQEQQQEVPLLFQDAFKIHSFAPGYYNANEQLQTYHFRTVFLFSFTELEFWKIKKMGSTFILNHRNVTGLNTWLWFTIFLVIEYKIYLTHAAVHRKDMLANLIKISIKTGNV